MKALGRAQITVEIAIKVVEGGTKIDGKIGSKDKGTMKMIGDIGRGVISATMVAIAKRLMHLLLNKLLVLHKYLVKIGDNQTIEEYLKIPDAKGIIQSYQMKTIQEENLNLWRLQP